MSDYPDYSPPPNYAYPPTPSNYVSLVGVASLAGTTPQTIHSFTDGKLYLLKYLTLSGTFVNTASGGFDTGQVYIRLTRGLDNSNTAYDLVAVAGSVGGKPSSNIPSSVFVIGELEQPIIFKAGSVGTPNVMEFLPNTDSTFAFNGVSFGTCWPIS